MTYRLLGLCLVIGIVMGLEACGSSQSTQKSVVDDKSDEEVAKARPSWFAESNRVKADSGNVYGYGMAVSYDSAESMNQAIMQARGQLNQMVDDSLEKLRKMLVERESGQDQRLTSTDFLIHLRNAVVKISPKSHIERSTINYEDQKWYCFVRIKTSWSTVNSVLRNELSDYPTFLKVL